MTNTTALCKKCTGETEGFKCDVCSVEAATHDPKHKHGAEHCMPKCKECNEAEAKCTC